MLLVPFIQLEISSLVLLVEFKNWIGGLVLLSSVSNSILLFHLNEVALLRTKWS